MPKKRRKKKERRCRNPECNKILSIYNRGKFCFACDSATDEDIPSMHSNRK